MTDCPECGGTGNVVRRRTNSSEWYRCTCPKCKGTGRAKNPHAVALGRLGGKARAAKLTPEQLSEIGRIGAAATNAKKALKSSAGRRKVD